MFEVLINTQCFIKYELKLQTINTIMIIKGIHILTEKKKTFSFKQWNKIQGIILNLD